MRQTNLFLIVEEQNYIEIFISITKVKIRPVLAKFFKDFELSFTAVGPFVDF